MPTARELLEQAEALMQRDRAALMGDGIPTLTDSVPTPGGQLDPAVDARRTPTALDDIPLLTESVEDLDTPSIPLAQSLDAELALWRETPNVSLHEAPADVAVSGVARSENVEPTIEPSSPSVSEPSEAIAATQVAESPAQTRSIEPEAPSVDESDRWNALAEDIRMQVLQRIDIFTDTGLKDQLNQRLQPIVDRASADLVAAINQHVGQLLRAYVAEAIEREIEKWRANSR
jgi:hypothetical protein